MKYPGKGSIFISDITKSDILKNSFHLFKKKIQFEPNLFEIFSQNFQMKTFPPKKSFSS